MDTTESFRGLACTDCGESAPADHLGRCDCGAPLTPDYDYDAVSLDRETVERRGADSMWRFDDLLPFPAPEAVSISEGATPLVEAPRLADELDVGRVVVKDEGRNPTGTVLDRGLSLAVTAIAGFGEDPEPLAHATPGNAGQAGAAYAGRADLRSYAFVPSRAPFSNKAMINVHGGEMRVVGGRYPDALAAVDEQLRSEWTSLQEFTNPYRHEGAKTVALETLVSLDWEVPDVVVTPVGTGEVLVGLAEGFRAAEAVGLVEDTPRLYAAQPTGCAPVVEAFEAGAAETSVWETPDTIVGELEIPDPAGGDLALAALREFGGGAVAVEDEAILRSAVTAAGSEGVEMGAAGGAAAAGAWELADDLAGDATVVLVNTESGTKTADVLRSHLMGQGI